MTRENAKDYLPLVQALADGKLQYRHKHATGGVWLDVKTHITFGEPLEHYRIKPEPMVAWAVQADGLRGLYFDKADAEQKIKEGYKNVRIIKLVEAVE